MYICRVLVILCISLEPSSKQKLELKRKEFRKLKKGIVPLSLSSFIHNFTPLTSAFSWILAQLKKLCMMLGIKPVAACMLGKSSTIELHSQPHKQLLKVKCRFCLRHLSSRKKEISRIITLHSFLRC